MLPYWVPPELSCVLDELRKKELKKEQKAYISSQINPLSIDIYQIGCLMYFLSFYEPANLKLKPFEGFEVK
jgi:hypothetical protein